MKDAALEAKVLSCIQKFGTGSGWSESFKKVKIKSDDWSITNHEVTGAILYRFIHVYCYSTWPNGDCKVQLFYFKQQYNGSGFNENILYGGVVSETPQESVDCD